MKTFAKVLTAVAMFVPAIGYSSEYPTGKELTEARLVFDRTFEAAEDCHYALTITKEYSMCDEFYELTKAEGAESLRQELSTSQKNNVIPKSDFLKAAFTVHHYYNLLKRDGETDHDFEQWWQLYHPRLMGVFEVNDWLYMAKKGGQYVPAN